MRSARSLLLAALALLLVPAGSEAQPAFYHKTDEILEFFRTTALKLPQLVRCALCAGCEKSISTFRPLAGRPFTRDIDPAFLLLLVACLVVVDGRVRLTTDHIWLSSEQAFAMRPHAPVPGNGGACSRFLNEIC